MWYDFYLLIGWYAQLHRIMFHHLCVSIVSHFLIANTGNKTYMQYIFIRYLYRKEYRRKNDKSSVELFEYINTRTHEVKK